MLPYESMPTPRAFAYGVPGVPVDALQPSPEESCLLAHAVPVPPTAVMIPESGLMTCSTPLMSSLMKIFPYASTVVPLNAPFPNMPFTARHPSPKASVDAVPAGRFGHCVPGTAAIGDNPPTVDIV